MEGDNQKIEIPEIVPRDISADYERIIKEEYGLLKFNEYLRSLRNEPALLLKIDLSQETDQNRFTWKANFMKAFREGGSSKRDKAQYEVKRPVRIAVIKCTRKQRNGDDPNGMKSTGWAANAFCSDVEWEEVK